MLSLIPYFAAFITLLFGVAFALVIVGEKVSDKIDKQQREKIKQNKLK